VAITTVFDRKFRVSRRRTLSLLGALAGTSALLRTPLAHAQARTLRMGYILAQDSQLGAGVTAFAQELAKRTNGRLAVDPFPNSVLGGDVELLKSVQLGSLDLAFVTGSPLPNVVPEVGVLSIPFLFRNAPHAYAVLDSAIGQAYLDKFRPKNLVGLAWGENGLRHLTSSKHEIKTPEDIKGLKLRLPQSDVMLAGFRALGAEAATLPFPELYDALQSGKFDSEENPIATIMASKFGQVQKYLTLSGHVYDPAIFVMSVDAFDELADGDKAAVVESAKLGAKASRVYAADAETKGVAALRQAGLLVTTQIDSAKFSSAMAPALAGFEKKYGPELIAKIRSIR
jgi:TRAP-type transport system periplasmic protein